jgi:predicted transcriptional regulator
MDKDLVSALSLYRSSKYRQKILLCLQGKTMMPSEIAKSVNLRLNHVSMTLKGLKEGGLVLCLNEEKKRGRLYELTELGKKVVAHEKGSST